MTFPANEIVRERLSPLGPSEPHEAEVTFNIQCGPTGEQRNSGKFHMPFTPQGPGKPTLTFAKLISAMLVWVTRVAETEGAWLIPEYIRCQDQFVKIWVELVGPTLAFVLDDVTATA